MAFSDRVVRALTDDGGLRVIAASTTEAVRGCLNAQGATGVVARQLGELVTGAVLYRETMAPNLAVQAIMQDRQHRGQLIADSMPDGSVRALVRRSRNELPELGAGSLFQMTRTLPNHAVHQGIVGVPESGSISDALMVYLKESEQVMSMVSVGARFDDEGLVSCGGYLVQLLPELSEGVLAVMTERLNDFPPVERWLVGEDAGPEHLVGELFYGMAHTHVGQSDVKFGCHCSEERFLRSLSTLPEAQIRELTESGEDLETACDYCGTTYTLKAHQVMAKRGC